MCAGLYRALVIGAIILGLGVCLVLGLLVPKSIYNSTPVPLTKDISTAIVGQQVTLLGQIILTASNPYRGPDALGKPLYYDLTDMVGNKVIMRFASSGATSLIAVRDLTGKPVAFTDLNGKWATFTGALLSPFKPGASGQPPQPAIVYVEIIQEVTAPPPDGGSSNP